ncbi:hypothetical protein FH608_029785 [Nonomuraea phyllanthi]|uniref:Uncharacterized protein n=1 Tax=Nonomuraea phyllanthi TaxID=2219224 RepID=A0A5C4W3T6_9ACTN|nr:hypothetical protein [Nonomuraea phyllanthi]KAB8191453.1 hypothetical protein FH608_029785 [Nonomuraea phyllanthi]QFY13220.1 hypothetical protein GBF35_47565 [Nonomuraea phyllanthi]
MRRWWVLVLAVAAVCAISSAVPRFAMTLTARQVPLDPPDAVLEDTFHLTEGIEVRRKLLPTARGVTFHPAYLAVGVRVDESGRLYGTPQRPGTYVAPVRLCAGQTCREQPLTLVVYGNVPWEPRELTFPGRVGVPLDGEIGVEGGPSDVIPTFTVTDGTRLPRGVSIGPDGHVSGTPAASGISEVPVRICVAGNCAGVVVRLIVV